MRVVILASANSGCDVWPMTLRDLKTFPAGSPVPIFSTMRCNPSGVQFEPSVCPMPKREVEQGNFFTNWNPPVTALGREPKNAAVCRPPLRKEKFSNSETACSAMLAMRKN